MFDRWLTRLYHRRLEWMLIIAVAGRGAGVQADEKRSQKERETSFHWKHPWVLISYCVDACRADCINKK